MRSLVALATVLATMMGWSVAEAAEARITSFVFGCETPDGEKLKPKFGDVDGVFYTDLPGQREQCLEAVKRKIALCRENTGFESNTKNEKHAGCLPIFREQAKVCVEHFTREQVKCGAGGPDPAEAARLDSSERQRVQAALAAEGFDPGPADGKFGPRTRRAIQAWQQANGYAATGELTSGQVEALLADAAPLEPFGPNWAIAENQPCQLYNPDAETGETVTWSGGCVDGKASGGGRWVWHHSEGEDIYEGTMRAGKEHGHGTATWANGDRYEGEWRDGEIHGRGTATWASGARYEGEWHDGKPHGYGIRTDTDGAHFEGEWRAGCFGERDGRWATIATTAAACGFE